MRVAVSKGSLLIPPTYFAVAHARALRGTHELRIFTGAAEITDVQVRDEVEIDETLPEVLPFTSAWPLRRREQAGALLWPVTARRIAHWHPDIVHQHFAYGARAALSAAKRVGIPLVVTVHGGDAFVPLTPPHERGLRARPALLAMQREVARVYREADLLLAVSEYIAGVAVRGGADPARVRVHYQGVDTDFFSPADGGPMPARRLLFVGRVVETKGVFDLLAASRAVLHEQPHELVFAGDGPARVALEREAKSSAHVRVLGARTGREIRDLMRTAHAVVLPTRANGRAREAAGLVLLEAQACGTPVVAYDSGGTSEMLRSHGETGWLVPEGDTQALARQLARSLMQSESERTDMARRARRYVVEHRSIAASARQLSAIYEELQR